MKTQDASMLITLCVFIVSACLASRAEVPEGGFQIFTNLFSFVDDALEPDLKTGEREWLRQCAIVESLVDERGWTTGQVVEALSYLVTNAVPNDTRLWPGSSVIYDKSLSMLPNFGGTNALPAIEYVIDRQNPLVSGYAFDEYTRVLGFGHDAFARYEAAILKATSTNQFVIGRACGEICSAFEREPRSNSESNRLVSLLMSASFRHPAWYPAWELDERKCVCWPGYAVSSNRLEHINFVLANDMPSHASNYFANVRAELLALPPGTMQMLPTNQFYNVED